MALKTWGRCVVCCSTVQYLADDVAVHEHFLRNCPLTLQEVRAVLEPTALPDHADTNMKGGRMSGSYAWFQTRNPYANLNISIEVVRKFINEAMPTTLN